MPVFQTTLTAIFFLTSKELHLDIHSDELYRASPYTKMKDFLNSSSIVVAQMVCIRCQGNALQPQEAGNYLTASSFTFTNILF